MYVHSYKISFRTDNFNCVDHQVAICVDNGVLFVELFKTPARITILFSIAMEEISILLAFHSLKVIHKVDIYYIFIMKNAIRYIIDMQFCI